MKRIITIIALALLTISCSKEGANPNEDCWKVTRIERGINYVGGGSAPSYITIFKDGIYRKVEGKGYSVGNWYCY